MENYVIVIIVIVVILAVYWLSQKSSTNTVDNDGPVIAAITKAIASCNAANDRASYDAFLADHAAAETLISGLAQPWSTAVTAAVNNFKGMNCDKYTRYVSVLNQLTLLAPRMADPNATDAEKDASAAIMVEYVKLDHDPIYNNTPAYIQDVMTAADNKYRAVVAYVIPDIMDLFMVKLIARLEKSANNDPPNVYNDYLTRMQNSMPRLARRYDLKGMDVKINAMTPKAA